MKSLLTLILVSFSSVAWGAAVNTNRCWNDQSLTTAQTLNSAAPLFTDAYAASIWGILKEESSDVSDEDARFVTTYLSTEYYGKKLPAYFMTQKSYHSPFTKSAPLMVILPGIFGSAFDPQEIAKAQNFYQQGYHVVILPNPWSVDAISHQPNYKPGNIEAEGNAVLALISAAIQHEISPKYVESVSVYGESYGALLAGIASGLDDAADPLITGKVMLASPPLKMEDAYHKLDQIYNESAPMRGYCKKNMIKVGVNYMRAKGQWDLRQDSLECAQALVSNNFYSLLSNAFKALQKTNLDLPNEPYEVSFNYYVSHYAPEMTTYCSTQTDHCNLSYWLSQAIQHGKNNFNIVSSKDDFLNSVSDWTTVQSILPDPDRQIILLNWGGHLGYNGSQAYTAALYQN